MDGGAHAVYLVLRSLSAASDRTVYTISPRYEDFALLILIWYGHNKLLPALIGRGRQRLEVQGIDSPQPPRSVQREAAPRCMSPSPIANC